MLASRPNPKLQNHLLPAVHGCSLIVSPLAAVEHICSLLYPKLRTRHVVTGGSTSSISEMLSVLLFDNNDYTECWCPTDNRQATTCCSKEWQLIKDSVQRNHGRECQSRRDSCMRCSCQSLAAVMHTRAWRLPLWSASIPGVGAQFLCATGKRRTEDNIKFNVSCTYRTYQDFLQQEVLMKVSYLSLIQLSVYAVKCRNFETGLFYVKIAVNVGSTSTADYPMHVPRAGGSRRGGHPHFCREGEW
jgi:hypothetical protein